ncbi:DUF2231 domain-containing protein [Streptomyces sp. NRRL B-24484]|uniref:DUF2231 domain-containing protein n=1 Tax=Streptomyces sp. NRRL B-24484 TaxID=1463833 RepID=UPI000694A98E|nr:DUF2231 domain-containing protein [Streptomyces sp. NRRL B-24484]
MDVHTFSGSRRSPLAGWLDAPSGWTALDPVSERLHGVVRRVPRSVQDALHGVWLGHHLHPALIPVPVGCWLSAAILDSTCTAPDAALRLTRIGLVGVAPAAWTGWADWSTLNAEQRRTGLVHAVGVVAAAALQGASLAARCRAARTGAAPTTGRLLGLAGLTVAGAAAALGGHLAHRQAPADSL